MSACLQALTSSLGNPIIPIPQSQALFHSFSYHYTSHATSSSISILRVPSCLATGLRDMSTQPLEPKSSANLKFAQVKPSERKNHKGKHLPDRDDEDDEDDDVGISKIQVPRQKYIPVSKSEILDALVSMMFKSDEEDDDVYQFRLLASCLDSILHAEHKRILEEMRSDYQVSNSVETEDSTASTSADSEMEIEENENESDTISNGSILGIEDREAYQGLEAEAELQKPFLFYNGLDLRSILRSLEKNSKKDSDTGSRVTVATRFQRTFMQLLSDAQFEELSARDLMLTSALNTDYLLTLPIYVDWKRAYESNAIVFRRGYATEKQKGLLIVEKLDYLQSILLRRIFFIISKPLGKLGSWISELTENASQKHEVQRWTEKLKLWLKELSLFQKSFRDDEDASDDQLGENQLTNGELPIGLAAQRAVARYEGILSPVGPRERLFRRLLSWIGFIPPTPETPFEVDNDTNALEPYLRPSFLSRISLSDIWKPATRKYCGNNLWKMLKTSISILFSQSVLQEPAFEELILLYTEDVGQRDNKDKPEIPALQLKIYERISIPDLPVIFPHKKLSFRVIDTVRLDAASILGLLAYFINYKFENVVSSPSAIFLDVVAISALIIYGSRVVLGYKQTWDRYQLLVNKTLYEKTLASGFGSVHFLLDASEQQQYKEAILAYAILLKAEKGQVTSRQSVADKCERFMYDVFKVKVEMPIDNAINTLLRLSLVTETVIDGRHQLLATPCPMAYEALQQRWSSLLT